MITLAALHLFNAVGYAGDKDVQDLAGLLEDVEQLDEEITRLQAEDRQHRDRTLIR